MATHWEVLFPYLDPVGSIRYDTVAGQVEDCAPRCVLGAARAEVARRFDVERWRPTGAHGLLTVGAARGIPIPLGADAPLDRADVTLADAVARADEQTGRVPLFGGPPVGLPGVWARLRTLVPDESVQYGALSAEISAAAVHADLRWPDELCDFFLLQSGGAQLIPPFHLLSLVDALDRRRRWLDVEGAPWSDQTSRRAPSARTHRAGTPCARFCPELVPIAEDATGATVVVDGRPGPLRGCVGVYSAAAGGTEALWSSISAMVTDAVDALATDSLFDRTWRAVSRDPLTWSRA